MQANYQSTCQFPIPFSPNNWNNTQNNQQIFSAQIQIQQQGPLNGPVLQMNPPGMPENAEFCSGCSKTYDQLAAEILTHYVGWSEYPEETIRDTTVRSRAIVDKFSAALNMLQNCWTTARLPLRDV